MPACYLDRSLAFCFYNKREKPNTLVSVFSGEVHTLKLALMLAAKVRAEYSAQSKAAGL